MAIPKRPKFLSVLYRSKKNLSKKSSESVAITNGTSGAENLNDAATNFLSRENLNE